MNMKFSILGILMVALCVGCTTDKVARQDGKGAGLGGTNTPNTTGQANRAPLPEFALGLGDKVSVRVWRNQELDRTVQIDPSGNINIPLIGDIPCCGLTLAQVRQEITTRLGRVLLNPQVDINLEEMKSRSVHVLGEVRLPGTFSLDRPIRSWEAVSKAGGFTVDADKKKILLVRIQDDHAVVSAFSLDNLLSGKGSSGGTYLRDGDIVYVPPSRIADIERFMNRFNNIIAPLVTVERGIVLGDEVTSILEGSRNRAIVVP